MAAVADAIGEADKSSKKLQICSGKRSCNTCSLSYSLHVCTFVYYMYIHTYIHAFICAGIYVYVDR